MNNLHRILSALAIGSMLLSCNSSAKPEPAAEAKAVAEINKVTEAAPALVAPTTIAQTTTISSGSANANSSKTTNTNKSVPATGKTSSAVVTQKSISATVKPTAQNTVSSTGIQSGLNSKGLQNPTVKTTNTTGKSPQTPQLPGNIPSAPTKTTTNTNTNTGSSAKVDPPTTNTGTNTNGGKGGRFENGGGPTTPSTPNNTRPDKNNGSGTTTTGGGGVGDVLGDILGGGAGNFTEGEAAKAIKEALMKGISTGVDKVSVTNGYFGNSFIKIPFPKDAQVVETTLRQVGMGSMIDNVVMASNRAAESAAKQALPIFVNSITQMTINDAINIVSNKQSDAATQFLQRTTTEPLVSAFKPSIKSALDKTLATKYWADVMGYYNKIPFVQKINTDLTDFVTRKAVSGLFYIVAQEEAKIRKDPGARTSDILKKVFGNVKF